MPYMAMTRPRRRTSRLQRDAADRARYLARRAGQALRDTRHAAGLTQAAVAERAGVAQTEVSRLERGFGAHADLETLAACGAALGLQLAAFFEQAPGASLPRDMQHLRRQNLIIVWSTPGGWTPGPESLLPNDGPRPRSIDVLLERPLRREAAVVEIWDLIDDGGAAMRGLEAKVLATRQRLGPDWHVEGLLLVRATRRNRQLVGGLRALFAARYTASSSAWLRALHDPNVPLPSSGGFAWTSVNGDRLIAARLG